MGLPERRKINDYAQRTDGMFSDNEIRNLLEKNL